MFLPVILSFWIGGFVGVKAGFVCEITFSEKNPTKPGHGGNGQHKQVKVYNDCVSCVKHHPFFPKKQNERS